MEVFCKVRLNLQCLIYIFFNRATSASMCITRNHFALVLCSTIELRWQQYWHRWLVGLLECPWGKEQAFLKHIWSSRAHRDFYALHSRWLRDFYAKDTVPNWAPYEAKEVQPKMLVNYYLYWKLLNWWILCIFTASKEQNVNKISTKGICI